MSSFFSLTISHFQYLSHYLSLSLSLTLTISHSHYLSLTLSHFHPLSLSLSPTLATSHSHCISLLLSLTSHHLSLSSSPPSRTGSSTTRGPASPSGSPPTTRCGARRGGHAWTLPGPTRRRRSTAKKVGGVKGQKVRDQKVNGSRVNGSKVKGSRVKGSRVKGSRVKWTRVKWSRVKWSRVKFNGSRSLWPSGHSVLQVNVFSRSKCPQGHSVFQVGGNKWTLLRTGLTWAQSTAATGRRPLR